MYLERKTARLLLRPLAEGDLDAVHAYAGDADNTRYMLRLPNRTRAETAAFLARVAAEWAKDRPAFCEFAAVLDGQVIGAFSVYTDETHSEGELGWVLNRRWWRRGYAVEAAAAVRDFALRELGLTRLTAHCDSRNTASFRVMQRIGMALVSDDGTRCYPDTGETARELFCVLEAGATPRGNSGK